ncbi:MAG: acyl-CoA thioesterase [Anaerolineae bacterium]|nr:acyl-CoA thioesterase [Anaerolineae bacterium]
MTPYYEYRHIVSFSETNLVGNVYYTNYLAWQGRCREMFLRDRAPEMLQALQQDLALVTVRVSCDFLAELGVFDEVAVRMWLEAKVQNRATMRFEYWRQTAEGEELIARGEQQIACMRRNGEQLAPAPFPKALQEALDYMTG